MRKQRISKKTWSAIIALILIVAFMFDNSEPDSQTAIPSEQVAETQTESKTDTENDSSKQDDKEVPKKDVAVAQDKPDNKTDEVSTTDSEKKSDNKSDSETYKYKGKSYKIIEVDGGDLSGSREPNVAVDIGFGDREYWALTNEYGQLVYVMADKVILQDDNNEPVNSSGRYYNDEAKVPGVERKDLDEGHIIADSLGGVSNAYNITPQNSTLNRHGDQAYMEKVIRDAGGCENFFATITYPDTTTQIPSKYRYEYVLNGNKIVDEFENVNPDEVNATIEKQEDKKEQVITDKADEADSSKNEKEELSKVDTNGNGQVTIAEAKAAGYRMPIYSDHWLYKYMDDRDHDGMVGE